MRRESVTLGHKTISYLIAEPLEPAVRQRPLSTVVFLHAFPLQGAMWESNLDAVPEGWRALAPDYRGDAGIGMSDLAGDVVDLLDHLGLVQAALVGCSMGGYVLFEILRSAPRYVSAVGLVSTRPGADNDEGRKNRQKMIEQVDREGVEAIAAQMVPKLLGATTQRDRPDVAKQVRNLVLANTPDRVKAAVGAMMARPDSTPLLGNIEVPALVVHGVEDALIPPAEAEGMHRTIKHSQLELIPFSGHLPNLEQPVSFDRILWQFLKKL
jgi:3-oxoadipate enol-lactonase